eukprot:c19139_g1_i1.p1 GENE.c19139_g1_i1~~c19139_g1_i1.p1  ORF type:complete len:298 (+),score=95.67 c19139_g1_i1:295-1188(+)
MEKQKLREELENSKREFNEATRIFTERSRILHKIREISSENSVIINNWKNKMAERKLDTWKTEELNYLLQSIGLEDWFDELNNQVLKSVKLNEARLVHFMNVQKSDGSHMPLGEAKYLWLTLQHIKEGKPIPQVVNDIDLDETNINLWKVENVVSYFKIKNLNMIANALEKAKVNGLVLTNLNESEIVQLGIGNEQVDLFLQILQSIQKIAKKLLTGNSIETSQNIPEIIICPLSTKPMKDPVIAQDGKTYERKYIEEWLQDHDKSPLTEEELIDKSLTPNNEIRKSSEIWRKKNIK